MGMKFTQVECDKQLAADVNKHNKEMMQYVKVPLNTYQEAALTSFSYNVGIGNFKNSTMLKYFNNKRYTEGCKQLINWVYAGGKKLPGLEIRRENEMDFCLGNVDLKAELKK
jgi:lysozyme